MEITKAVMTTDGPMLRMSVPIAKIDKENRIVSGFATLDNVDQHGDVVTADASTKAFTRFRGNLREMHAPIAVGKVLKFDEVEFYDAESDSIYRGVFVDAFVSRGSQDTWEKVLDGTLSGFSIGGKVLAEENKVVKSADKESLVRHIIDYELLELSLVDSPANQFANVLTISKSESGAVLLKGIAVDVNLENILYCPTDKVAVTSDKDSADCANCGVEMKNIGWVESQASDKIDKIRTAVAKQNGMVNTVAKSNGNLSFPGTITPTSTYTSGTNGIGYTINISMPNTSPEEVAKRVQKEINNTLEGGVDTNMSKETKNDEAKDAVKEADKDAKEATKDSDKEIADAAITEGEEITTPKAENVEEVTPTEEAPAVDETVDTAEKVDEVESEETDLAKMFGEFAARIESAMQVTKTETTEVLKSVQTEVTSTVEALDTKVSELETKFSALEGTVSKRVDAVEGDTAFKKSADLGGSAVDNTKKESIWSGRFLNANISDITS